LELALEEPIELLITRRLLAVLDAEGIGGVARLLGKDLGKFDHIRRVQFLGEVHHRVGIILLVASTCAGEKRAKGGDSDGIALLAASRGITCCLPLRRRIGDHLSNALAEMGRGGGHRRGRCESEKDSGELNHDLFLERSSAGENEMCERSSRQKEGSENLGTSSTRRVGG
jgi:hypothetical protein